MANIIESSNTVRDIVEEVEDVNRYCDILRKLDMPTMTIDGQKRPVTTDIYQSIECCLERYRELLLDTKLYKGVKDGR